MTEEKSYEDWSNSVEYLGYAFPVKKPWGEYTDYKRNDDVVFKKITDKGIEVVDDSGDNSAKKKDFHYWESLTNFKRSYHAFVAGYNYVKPSK